MGNKILREIWWNSVPVPDEERTHYFFVIFNDSRERRKIKSRIIEAFASVDEFRESSGKVNEDSYNLISFYSIRSFENWQKRKISQGNWKRDERLYEREKNGREGLENYVASRISKE